MKLTKDQAVAVIRFAAEMITEDSLMLGYWGHRTSSVGDVLHCEMTHNLAKPACGMPACIGGHLAFAAKTLHPEASWHRQYIVTTAENVLMAAGTLPRKIEGTKGCDWNILGITHGDWPAYYRSRVQDSSVHVVAAEMLNDIADGNFRLEPLEEVE